MPSPLLHIGLQLRGSLDIRGIASLLFIQFDISYMKYLFCSFVFFFSSPTGLPQEPGLLLQQLLSMFPVITHFQRFSVSCATAVFWPYPLPDCNSTPQTVRKNTSCPSSLVFLFYLLFKHFTWLNPTSFKVQNRIWKRNTLSIWNPSHETFHPKAIPVEFW